MGTDWYITTHEPRVRSREWRGERRREFVEPTGRSLSDWRTASGQAAKRARAGRFGK
jgi:hypothetical protein